MHGAGDPAGPAGATGAGRLALIALGSNVGDRAAHLAAARARIAILPSTQLLAASQVEETAPLGAVPQGAYLNQMVAVHTSLPADTMLDALHAVERTRGRARRERWGPRTLDLDIVEIDGEVRTEGAIILPHPGLAARDFWQRERAELRSLMPFRTPPAMVAVQAGSDGPRLPRWAVAGERRREHIIRVTNMLDGWADTMHLEPAEREAWRDAGRLHDALRDADETFLRAVVSDPGLPAHALHGHAAAALLEADGESRGDVLEAVRHHTLGHHPWGRTGRALYMADYLDPGRSFAVPERADLATRVPHAFDDAFREVVRHRVSWAAQAGRSLHPATMAMRDAAR
ncbi:MAG: 2-amino-4-hydroxy-6-hydroxymethyldihydropteridine diphosphokinase [Gemmatimonadaceae bacterium]|nr:2-amino-4-hydroxy-6-hydroxymethyldihydropteridine diphosphokinase [Gemmatimonadaceae bacterium]